MDLPVTVGYKSLQKQTPKVNVYYPFVIGLANHQAELKINSTIVSTLNKTMIELGYHDSNLQEMVGEFEIKTNERNIFSLTLTVYSFTGGAHGMTIVKSLSFDVTTGKQYELKDYSNQIVITSRLYRQLFNRKLKIGKSNFLVNSLKLDPIKISTLLTIPWLFISNSMKSRPTFGDFHISLFPSSTFKISSSQMGRLKNYYLFDLLRTTSIHMLNAQIIMVSYP